MGDSKDGRIQCVNRVAVVVAILIVTSIFGFIFGNSFLKNGSFWKTTCDFNENFSQNRRIAFSASEISVGDVANQNSGVFVHIGGKPIGIAITAGGLIVVGDGAVKTDMGDVYPSRDLIKTGDIILSINGEPVSSIYQLKKVLASTESKDVQLVIERDGETRNVEISPAIERVTGQKKLGLALKEDVGGIGTLTFVTESGAFAALGHYINDAETGLDSELDGGNIYDTSIDSVEKGEIGKAGGLVASVNRLSSPIGKIKANTNIGLYGEYMEKSESQLYRVAMKGEATPGHAQVLTTVDGDEPKFYDIEIVKVVSQTEPGDKGMVIAISDKELISKTGGIVQGMSGSPIVQNGMLVGAVTHVFIQDPTRGYAVHARFMLEEAEKVVSAKTDKTRNLTLPNIEDFDLAA